MKKARIFATYSFIQKRKSMENEKVRGQINDMQLGDTLTFPVSRYDYIASCRSRLQKTDMEKPEDERRKWRIRSKKNSDTLTLTRYI